MDDDNTQRIEVLERGTQVSHYTIIDRIGSGGMGEVYLAEDSSLNRKVALKFLSSRLCLDSECRARFKREAQAAAKLNHPNVITIYEVGEHCGRPYFVMEAIEGESLLDLTNGRPQAIAEVIDIAQQLCLGLSEAHEHGIIHRDIKPANIMREKSGRYKILDFGVAKSVTDRKSTQSKVLIGTVDYMSPEQIRGAAVDHRSDLYSLGVLLYELLTGVVPFAAADVASTLRQIDIGTPKDIQSYRSDIDYPLIAIVTKLLEKDPSSRYQSASEVRLDLAKLDGGATTSLSPRPKSGTALVRMSRSRLLLTASALVLLAGAALLLKHLSSSSEQTLLAILPLRNLGSIDREYFAEGLRAELLSHLACYPAVGVISTNSTESYKGTSKDSKLIGKELGVDYLLEGTVRWDESEVPALVRINFDLIRTSDAVVAWSAQRDAEFSGILRLQTELAVELAQALNVTLAQNTSVPPAASRSSSAEAVDFLMRGDRYFQNLTPDGLRKAQEMYQRAIIIDSRYAMAHAKLGEVHARIFWYFYDRSQSRLDSASDEIRTALRLDPQLPEAHTALGYYYYYAKREYDSALTEFRTASALQPGNGELYLAIAYVQRRQAAWADSRHSFERARKLSPRDPELLSEFAGTLIALREYQAADSLLALSRQLAPDMPITYYHQFMLHLLDNGDTSAAASVVADAESNNKPWWGMARYAVLLLFIERQFESADKLLDRFANEVRGESIDLAEYYGARSDLYRFWGKSEIVLAYCDSLRTCMERELREKPDEPWYHVMLGRALVGLGERERAILEVKVATNLLPTSKDAYDGPDLELALAEVYANAGHTDDATQILEQLLSIPSFTSVPLYRLWPDFAVLRTAPGFERLLSGKGSP